MPAAPYLEVNTVASGVILEHPVAAGQCVHWSDVEIDESCQAVIVRRELEATLADSRAA